MLFDLLISKFETWGVQKGKRKTKQSSAMNKLTDGDSFQFALKPPQYQRLCLPDNGDWGWRRVPAAEAHGKIPDPLPNTAPISEWGPDGYSCFKALFPWAHSDSISDPENEVLWGK